MAAQNDGDYTAVLTAGTFAITPVNAVRMLMMKAPALNTANVTYKGNRKWINDLGVQVDPVPIPIEPGTFLAIPTDGATILIGEIVVPTGNICNMIAKT